jgi:quercetin dioxygenase-like cupin family protein
MRRHTVLTPIVALVALVVIWSPALTGAQQTPTAIVSVGVSGGPLGSGAPEAAPGYTLWLRHGAFEPGGIVPLHHHPGALVLYIESGELTYSVAEGEAVVTRAASEETPGPTEQIGPGKETTLRTGDSVFEQGVVHIARNDGDTPVELLIAALATTDQPFTQYHEPATPAA